jgi:hypothetical protein
MKATLQPYSQKELKEIAENVARYRRESLREYTYTDEHNQPRVAYGTFTQSCTDRLFLMQRDLLRHGTHNKEAADGFTYKVIGETIC